VCDRFRNHLALPRWLRIQYPGQRRADRNSRHAQSGWPHVPGEPARSDRDRECHQKGHRPQLAIQSQRAGHRQFRRRRRPCGLRQALLHPVRRESGRVFLDLLHACRDVVSRRHHCVSKNSRNSRCLCSLRDRVICTAQISSSRSEILEHPCACPRRPYRPCHARSAEALHLRRSVPIWRINSPPTCCGWTPSRCFQAGLT
jgi:hypothetical protein